MAKRVITSGSGKVWGSTGVHTYSHSMHTVQGGVSANPDTKSGHLGPADLNEKQLITLTSATGGTFSGTFEGQTASSLGATISASALQTALEGLSTVGAGNIAVSGDHGGPFTIEFLDSLAALPLPLLTVDGTSLTGSGHAIAVTRLQAGASVNGSVRPSVGLGDYILPTTHRTAEAPSASPGSCAQIRTGRVTIPQAPVTGEERNRTYWRGNTFSGRGIVMPAAYPPVKAPTVSALTTTVFDITNAGFSGQFVDSTNSIAYRRLIGTDDTVDLTFTGTALVLSCYASAHVSAEASVDGGAYHDITPDTLSTWLLVTIAANLTDTTHTVSIRTTAAGTFFLDRTATGPFLVTGAAPACTANLVGTQYLLGTSTTDSLSRAGILNRTRLNSGYATASVAGYTTIVAPSITLFVAAGENASAQGASVLLAGTIGALYLWTLCDGSQWRLTADSTPAATVTAPNTGRWGWVTISTTLDATTNHSYLLTNAFYNTSDVGSGTVFALRTTGGTGVVTGSQPAQPATYAYYGDDHVRDQAGETTDFTTGWVWPQGHAYVNLGVDASTVKHFGAGAAPVVAYAGETRTADVTALAPAPTKIVVVYGTNDLAQAGGAETSAAFQTSYTSMITALAAGVPAAKIYCVGIFPRSDFTSLQIAPWNTAIAAAVTALANANVSYVDPASWALNGAGSDYTTNYQAGGIWLNAAGRAIVATQLATAIV